MIAQRITSVPGSSRSFLGGAIVYSDELKTAFAGVPAELIAKHGAVSAEVARSPGQRASASAPAQPWDWASPASPAPPAAPRPSPSAWSTSPSATRKRPKCIERTFRGDRTRVREWATQQALDLIRRRLR